MPNRASIFSPFDALEGLKNELKKAETVKESMPILSQEEIDNINETLRNINIEDKIKVTYFKNKKRKIEGEVKKINIYNKTIKVEQEEINFYNIIYLEKI